MEMIYKVYVLAQNEKELCKKGMRVCGKETIVKHGVLKYK
ncbi:1662_t:CDS:2 [Entrophospora sp. SA101]|nr:1662_t:CDS:2 [Entrophospora sp. SA101]